MTLPFQYVIREPRNNNSNENGTIKRYRGFLPAPSYPKAAGRHTLEPHHTKWGVKTSGKSGGGNAF
ncbi:hypothetical protein N7501_000486 [Penicillium viridicatum]|nr:hypothetical protein N7501_000486 [Penicillium viridicatum]